MEPIKFISPSSFYYWEKCPLKAIYSKEFRDQQIFPKHPDADLGSLIHSFYEKRKDWDLLSPSSFDDKWEKEINKIDNTYKKSNTQNIFYPIKWHAKYYAVKKQQLIQSLFQNNKVQSKTINRHVKYEKWLDDGQNIGGKVDYMLVNEKEEVIEIVDFKTGNIFEFIDKKRVIKSAYTNQITLYAYIIKLKQKYYPNCFIQDLMGNKYKVEIKDEIVQEIYTKAIELKNKINRSIGEGRVDQLANVNSAICSYCEYRPFCEQYKSTLINNFKSKHVDIFGKVIKVTKTHFYEFKIQIEEKILTLKNITSAEFIKANDNIYVYNLFCPDGDSQTLYAMKDTLIKHE